MAGSTWSYDVVERTRSRPQDESGPWSPWEIEQIHREAVGLEEQVLDERTYVLLRETDYRPGAPPDPSPAVPHRRDATGLHHRPRQVVGVSANGAEDPVLDRRGGPVGRDDLLVPHPARLNDEFVSNRSLHEIRVIEAREAIRTGMGVIPAIRIRVVARDTARPGDSIVEWYTLQGRVASHTNFVRVTFGPNRQPYWTEVDRTEILRRITP